MAESEGLRGCWGACLTCSSSPTPERPGAGISIVRNSPNYFDAGLRLPFEVPWLRGPPQHQPWLRVFLSSSSHSVPVLPGVRKWES